MNKSLFNNDRLHLYHQPGPRTYTGATIRTKTNTVPALNELTKDKGKKQMAR